MEALQQRLQGLQQEIRDLAEWIHRSGEKVAIVLEGRDGAGKTSMIRAITEHLSTDTYRIAALRKPTGDEKEQWYFHRYAAQLPKKGELVLFDRSWYNRGLVERINEWCTDEEYTEFLRFCPLLEEHWTRSGIRLLKYWLEIDNETQRKRLLDRGSRLTKMDKSALGEQEAYLTARDAVLKETSTKISPWHGVRMHDRTQGQAACMEHIIEQFNYTKNNQKGVEIEEEREIGHYWEPATDDIRWITR